jgi:prepilin-type N-terminal cleavage/methylation domain-containing protein
MNEARPHLWMDLSARRGKSRPGFSLLEIMMVLTMIGVLLAMSAPSFQRATEQAQADIAAANLRAIWAAQRFYWLENRRYTLDLAQLQDLLDPSIPGASTPYAYSIKLADSTTFTATATRTGSSMWTGQLTIDQTGMVSGFIQASGENNIVPGFQ